MTGVGYHLRQPVNTDPFSAHELFMEWTVWQQGDECREVTNPGGSCYVAIADDNSMLLLYM
jgi:hypothetical protein